MKIFFIFVLIVAIVVLSCLDSSATDYFNLIS